MQGIKRKLVYVTVFEVGGIGLSMVLVTLLGHDPALAGGVAVGASVIAMLWNLVWNTGFEFWEARQIVRGRSFKRRALHALGFELGLTIMLVPAIAWWLAISWWEALLLDIGLTLVFVVYTFVFNLGFDRVFGLPASALPLKQEAGEAG
ncbi:MAG: hypothetical protein CMI01_06440 [Oceanospirillaceae bacterium]|jgi:uncharacterized membrane protein|uniref:PACE efflux transporter n=1 Tax=Marinobacterium litorale TaxID=404770 RepID=UPI00042969F5|nr:PACE efflux transporter [Marinobacterium litorale]MBS98298.1 hypothetical protein [Oceanospirillaceae bacterium]